VALKVLSPEDICPILVVDAITGQNALAQAKAFNEAMPLKGLILTKFDHTAKGGTILAVTSELNVPVLYIGVGEGMEDLEPFSCDSFVEDLLGGGVGA